MIAIWKRCNNLLILVENERNHAESERMTEIGNNECRSVLQNAWKSAAVLYFDGQCDSVHIILQKSCRKDGEMSTCQQCLP